MRVLHGCSYGYGGPIGDPWQVNRTVQLAFYPNGSLARLNHTEVHQWGITHSIDFAQGLAYDEWQLGGESAMTRRK